jgi:hypothetical protein
VVGHLFEAYVGRLLRLVPGATVLPARTYGKSNTETVDWLVVDDHAVVLVEVKSVRPTDAARQGTEEAAAEVSRMLGRSREQIAATAQLIRARHPVVHDIPSDRPMVGLTVTMEPFHVINSGLHRSWLPDATVPAAVCGAAELESLVSVEGVGVGQLLLEAANDSDRRGWSVGSLTGSHALRRNPVLDEAWMKYPCTAGSARALDAP